MSKLDILSLQDEQRSNGRHVGFGKGAVRLVGSSMHEFEPLRNVSPASTVLTNDSCPRAAVAWLK